MTEKQSAAERAAAALAGPRAFCDLLAAARRRRVPGWWEGSAYRSHPCGLVVDTILFTNFWHVDNISSIEITDGLGWDVAGVHKAPRFHGDPHPKPIEGGALRVWWCGRWSDAQYEEALRPRVLEILTSVAEQVAVADQDEEVRLAADVGRILQEGAVRRAAAIAKIIGKEGG